MIALGTGIYTPGEAAALLHEKPATVRRWAFGYRRVRPTGPTRHAPLIATDLPVLEGKPAISFVELIELLYIRAFTAAGASWGIIKEAANVAARELAERGHAPGGRHPFAMRNFFVDPEGLLYVVLNESDDSEAVVLLRGHGQHAFPQLVKPYLDQIDFGLDDVATRWWPLGREGGVCVDPLRAFGAPIVEEAGIRAGTLADVYDAELPQHGARTVDRVAWLYEIPPRSVETALGFRRWLTAARGRSLPL
ncbi:MAG TPA: hypothetical protein VEX86_07595 [Longimicrobium sp.]|nr:hypothetical protein [Longimicrobium sp.]